MPVIWVQSCNHDELCGFHQNSWALLLWELQIHSILFFSPFPPNLIFANRKKKSYRRLVSTLSSLSPPTIYYSVSESSSHIRVRGLTFSSSCVWWVFVVSENSLEKIYVDCVERKKSCVKSFDGLSCHTDMFVISIIFLCMMKFPPCCARLSQVFFMLARRQLHDSSIWFCRIFVLFFVLFISHGAADTFVCSFQVPRLRMLLEL